jgi:hypothetical protein
VDWKLPKLTVDGVDLFATWRTPVRRSLGFSAVKPVSISEGPNGKQVKLDGPYRKFVRLSGASSPYTGVEVYPTAGGTWATFPDAGTITDIHDGNDLGGLNGKVVEILPTADGWICFFLRMGEPPTGCVDCVSVPDCPCMDTPRVLAMTSSHPSTNDGMFQNAVLSYVTLPSSLNELSLPSQGHISDSQYLDQRTGDLFWYYFSCDHGSYTISRLYEVSVSGSPYRDIVRYRWLNGQVGNTCHPFELTNGIIFAGGDATCVVTITRF